MKKQRLHKALVAFVALFLFGGVFANVASANSISRTNPVGFGSAWERNVTADGGRMTLTFGFNTRLINEDYAWSRHTTRNHFASVRNNRGNFSSPNRGPRTTARIEVRHAGSGVGSVTYRGHW